MTVAFGTHVNLMNNDLLDIRSAEFATAAWTSNDVTISVTTPVQFDAWNYSLYRSAEYLFQFSQLNNFYQCKLLIIHNGTDIGVSEYAQVGIGNDIPYSVDASLAVANMELTVACSTADINPVVMKFSRVLFDA